MAKRRVKSKNSTKLIIIIVLVALFLSVLGFKIRSHTLNQFNKRFAEPAKSDEFSKAYKFNKLGNGFNKVENTQVGFSFEIPDGYNPVFGNEVHNNENGEDIDFQSANRYKDDPNSNPVIFVSVRDSVKDAIVWDYPNKNDNKRSFTVQGYEAFEAKDSENKTLIKTPKHIFIVYYLSCPTCLGMDRSNMKYDNEVPAEKEAFNHLLNTFTINY